MAVAPAVRQALASPGHALTVASTVSRWWWSEPIVLARGSTGVRPLI